MSAGGGVPSEDQRAAPGRAALRHAVREALVNAPDLETAALHASNVAEAFVPLVLSDGAGLLAAALRSAGWQEVATAIRAAGAPVLGDTPEHYVQRLWRAMP